MKFLVLGGTGFVGEKIFTKLKNEGHSVSRSSRSLGTDLLNYESVLNLIKTEDPDIIYNLASHGGSMMYVKNMQPMFTTIMCK